MLTQQANFNPDQPLQPADAYRLWATDYPDTADNLIMRIEEKAMLAQIPHDLNGRNIIDVGCGSGRYLHRLCAQQPAALLGVDLVPAMLARVQKRSGLWLTAADLCQLPLRSGWADWLVCALVIGHVEDLETALRELSRVVRPGGTLVLSDLHPESAKNGWKRTFRNQGKVYQIRHRFHNINRWQQAAAQAGLRICTLHSAAVEAEDLNHHADAPEGILGLPAVLVVRMEKI